MSTKLELRSVYGSDPNDPKDKGIPPPPEELVALRFTIGDYSGSHSERYNMIVPSSTIWSRFNSRLYY